MKYWIKLFLLAPLFLAACGYHFVGRSRAVPEDARTIFIGEILDQSHRVDAVARMRQALAEELESWPRLTVVESLPSAHLLLEGEILRFQLLPALSTRSQGKKTRQLSVTLSLRLIDRRFQTLLAENRRIEFQSFVESDTLDLVLGDEEMHRVFRTMAAFAMDALLDQF